jgi:hypothetical protein
MMKEMEGHGPVREHLRVLEREAAGPLRITW